MHAMDIHTETQNQIFREENIRETKIFVY